MDHPFQGAARRMAAVGGGVGLRRLGKTAAGFTGLDDPAKHQSARRHVYLRALIARLQPDLGHDVVGWIVAPPRAVMLGFWRQFCAGDFLYFAERQRYFPRALLVQERTQILVFTHLSGPPLNYIQCNTLCVYVHARNWCAAPPLAVLALTLRGSCAKLPRKKQQPRRKPCSAPRTIAS